MRVQPQRRTRGRLTEAGLTPGLDPLSKVSSQHRGSLCNYLALQIVTEARAAGPPECTFLEQVSRWRVQSWLVTQAAPLSIGTQLDNQGHVQSLMNPRSHLGHPHSSCRNCRQTRGRDGQGTQTSFLPVEVSGPDSFSQHSCESVGQD